LVFWALSDTSFLQFPAEDLRFLASLVPFFFSFFFRGIFFLALGVWVLGVFSQLFFFLLIGPLDSFSLIKLPYLDTRCFLFLSFSNCPNWILQNFSLLQTLSSSSLGTPLFGFTSPLRFVFFFFDGPVILALFSLFYVLPPPPGAADIFLYCSRDPPFFFLFLIPFRSFPPLFPL